MDEIIIFGASNLGRIAFNYLKEKYDILGFLDNSEEKWGHEFCGKIIIPITDINKYKDNTIIIASSYVDEIKLQLEMLGVKKVKEIELIDIFGEQRCVIKEEKEKQIDHKSNITKILFIIDGNDIFCRKIAEILQKNYQVRIINRIISEAEINEGIKWCDLCWFEWCDKLIAYYSNLEIIKQKKVICRIHSYEVFEQMIYKVNWGNIDKIIFVCNWVKENFKNKVQVNDEKLHVIPNIFDFNNWKFEQKAKGYNIAVVGNIGWKKNFPMLIQFFYELWKKDKNYKIYIAYYGEGEIEKRYLEKIIDKLELNNNVYLCGKIDHNQLSDWFRDKQYILSGSIIESQGMNILEGMACGCKPVISYFPYAEELYPRKYIYHSLDEFIEQITNNDYFSLEYRKFVDDNFQENTIVKKIIDTIET